MDRRDGGNVDDAAAARRAQQRDRILHTARGLSQQPGACHRAGRAAAVRCARDNAGEHYLAADTVSGDCRAGLGWASAEQGGGGAARLRDGEGAGEVDADDAVPVAPAELVDWREINSLKFKV